MRKILIMLTALPLCVFSQDKPEFGVIGGANFANVTGTSSISRSNSSGYMFGVFMAPPSKGILSKRIEFLFSRQGYDYKTNTNTGSVDLNYIMVPTLTGIKIGKFALIQAGLQTAILLNAKADTSSNQSAAGQPPGMMNMMSMMNRFNWAAAAGLQIYPFKGIIIGARYNIALNQTYKEMDPNNPMSSIIPDVDVKHNLVQLFLGYKF
jgi:Outer membrane protein beta-barrel domain